MHLPIRIRSLLFAPANAPRKIQNAVSSQADAVILDLEDAVLAGDKGPARQILLESLPAANARRPACLLRVNAADTQWFEQDAALAACMRVDGVMLPKCEHPEDVGRLVSLTKGLCWICPLIESPTGLLCAFEIASSSTAVLGLAFGAEDFVAEMGIERSEGEPELLHARSHLAAAATAAGVQMWDSPDLELHDMDRVRKNAEAARRLGFRGKLAIHPRQIPEINAVFAPSESDLSAARQLLDAFSSSGAGVFEWQGRMVDVAVLRHARRILGVERKPYS